MQKPKHEGRVIVLSATNGVKSGGFDNVLAYETPTGSFMFRALMKLLRDEENPCTLEEALDAVKKMVSQEARKYNLSQIPDAKVFGPGGTGASMLHPTFKVLDTILIVCPSYGQGNLPEGHALNALPGARDDMHELLCEIKEGKVLPFNCKVIVAGDVHGGLFRLPHLRVVPATQENGKKLVLETLVSKGNVAVFLFGHGMQGMNGGRKDECMMFPETPRERPENGLWGLDVARALVQKVRHGEGISILVADLCYSHGFPDREDMNIAMQEAVLLEKQQGVMVARGGRGHNLYLGQSYHDTVKELVREEAEEAVKHFAFMHVQGYPIGKAMGRAVEYEARKEEERYTKKAERLMYPGQEDLCGLSPYALPEGQFDYLQEADSWKATAPLAPAPSCVVAANQFRQPASMEAIPPPPPPEAIPPMQETVSVARAVCPEPAIPVEPLAPVNADADAPGPIQARGLESEVVEGIASVSRQVLNNISIVWHGLETTCGCLFGAGVLSFLTPLLIAAFLATVGAALWLYLHYMVRNEARTLFPMLLVMAVTTLMPYLCDPAMLQSFFAVDNAICVGLCCTAASFVVLLVSVAADWNKLSSRVSAVFKATNLASKYALIARLALEIHLMGGGRAIQQSIHVQVGGVNSFVMYFPLMYNGTNLFCPVPLRNNKFKLLPSRTGYTVFDKELDDGSKADLTCQYAVFQSRVAFRSKGDVRNVKAWSFNNGQDVIDFKDLHLDTQYLERAVFNVNTTERDSEALLSRVGLVRKLDAAWTAKGKHFPIKLPTMAKKTPPTTLEWVAAPVFFAVEKLVGVSLWAFRARGAPLSREL